MVGRSARSGSRASRARSNSRASSAARATARRPSAEPCDSRARVSARLRRSRRGIARAKIEIDLARDPDAARSRHAASTILAARRRSPLRDRSRPASAAAGTRPGASLTASCAIASARSGFVLGAVERVGGHQHRPVALGRRLVDEARARRGARPHRARRASRGRRSAPRAPRRSPRWRPARCGSLRRHIRAPRPPSPRRRASTKRPRRPSTRVSSSSIISVKAASAAARLPETCAACAFSSSVRASRPRSRSASPA